MDIIGQGIIQNTSIINGKVIQDDKYAFDYNNNVLNIYEYDSGIKNLLERHVSKDSLVKRLDELASSKTPVKAKKSKKSKKTKKANKAKKTKKVKKSIKNKGKSKSKSKSKKSKK